MPDTLPAVLERDAARVEGRPRPEAPVAPAGPRRRWRGVRVLRRWLRWRYGRIAPHGVSLVGLYAVFIALAHLLSFGRVERSLLLTLVVGFVSLVFLAMIALFAWTLWGALRDTVGWTASAHGRRQILLFTAAAGLLLVLLPRLFSKDVLSYIMYGRA